MRQNKRFIALMLCSALLVSGSGAGIGAGKVQAASSWKDQTHAVRMLEGDVTDGATDGAIDDGNEETKPTSSPAVETETPETGAPETEAPAGTPETEQTPEATQPATPTATEPSTPSATNTPGGQTTLPPVSTVTPGAVSTPSALTVGTKITVGNYVYAIVTEATAQKAGTVKLNKLTDAAKSKATLTVPEKITKDGYSFTVTGIGQKAFTTSTALKKITIKKNVTYIGVRAFQGVKTLETVLIGDGVTTIKERAFAGCSSIRTVTLPTQLKFIGVRSFYNCTKLKAVVISSKKLTTVRQYAFNKTKSTRYFMVPSGKKSLYQSLIKSSGVSLKMYTF